MFIVETLKGERVLCAKYIMECMCMCVCVLFSYYKGSNVIANATYCIQMYVHIHIFSNATIYTKPKAFAFLD